MDRSHDTYGRGDAIRSPRTRSAARASTAWGICASSPAIRACSPRTTSGIQLGVVLPTGNYGGPNADGTGIVGRKPVAFNSGPNSQNPSPDNLLDTSLQAGVGATDIIVGAYYYQAVSQDFDAFVNGQFQAAVAHKLDQPGEDFRPGNQVAVSVGARYVANPAIVPQLQVNFSRKGTDQGVLADTIGSGGTVVYLSPGLGFTIAANVQAFAFVQVPVYSRLDGIQLFPHWTGRGRHQLHLLTRAWHEAPADEYVNYQQQTLCSRGGSA